MTEMTDVYQHVRQEGIESAYDVYPEHEETVQAVETLRSLPPSPTFVAWALDTGEDTTQTGISGRTQLPERTVQYGLNRLEDEQLVDSRPFIGDARKTAYHLDDSVSEVYSSVDVETPTSFGDNLVTTNPDADATIDEQAAALPPSAKYTYRLLEEHGSQVRQSLSDYSLLSPRTTRYGLRRLSEAGLVTEAVSVDDARKTVYKPLTDGGKEQP